MSAVVPVVAYVAYVAYVVVWLVATYVLTPHFAEDDRASLGQVDFEVTPEQYALIFQLGPVNLAPPTIKDVLD